MESAPGETSVEIFSLTEFNTERCRSVSGFDTVVAGLQPAIPVMKTMLNMNPTPALRFATRIPFGIKVLYPRRMMLFGPFAIDSSECDSA